MWQHSSLYFPAVTKNVANIELGLLWCRTIVPHRGLLMIAKSSDNVCDQNLPHRGKFSAVLNQSHRFKFANIQCEQRVCHIFRRISMNSWGQKIQENDLLSFKQ